MDTIEPPAKTALLGAAQEEKKQKRRIKKERWLKRRERAGFLSVKSAPTLAKHSW